MPNVKFLIAASLGLGLAGCGTLPTNTSMYSVHQPVVERSNYAIDLALDGNGIAIADQRRMNEWFDVMNLGYGDRVSIDNGGAYTDPAVTNDVAKALADRGVAIADVAPATTGAIAPGTVRVIVMRSRASVPSCPDWSSTHENNYNAGNHSNHGCASNSNLAAMVADPEDLVRGRESKKLDSNSGKAAVNTYKTKTGGN
jgi:pilus assembly protein CpaD